jgi:hypothetical protein
MGSYVSFDLSEYRDFFALMKQAAKGDFKRELGLFLEGLGNEFLRVLEDEIIRREVVDTRLLLNSFHKGSEDGVWEINKDGLTLEVGTSIEYAGYVNDGHWTAEKGSAGRWVPGQWSGDRFIYDPNAKTGMYLKQQWVPGKHYWESALRILNEMYPDLLESKLQDWLDNYFGV